MTVVGLSIPEVFILKKCFRRVYNTNMKAIRIQEYGGLDVLKYEDAPVPSFGADEILIKVHSAGVNPIDWKVREGELKDIRPYTMPIILGWEVSGIVEEVGALVGRFKIGDKVYSKLDMIREGGYAEYVGVKSYDVAHAPKSIPLEQSAGIPLACQTAWTALFDKGNLKKGQSVLIHAASGGVGHFATQLAKAVGAKVIATTSSSNIDSVKSLGADIVIDYKSEDFSEKVKDMDVVLDTIGGDTRARSWQCLRKDGVMVSVVARVEPFDPEMIKKHNVRAEGVAIVSNGARLQEISNLVDSGKLKVVIAKEFLLKDVKEAHKMSESGHTHGKIILRVS